ncbi:MAG: topoisomerase DNA-binding C4 zinc finger domain-containing protein [Chloroflexota bacterium]
MCPKCGVPMVVRTASRGEHQGKPFYGCPNFPRCREVAAIV